MRRDPRLAQRLMEAEDRTANALYDRGMSRQAVEEALDTLEERLSEEDRSEDLFLAALEHYVAALSSEVEGRTAPPRQRVQALGPSARHT